MTAAALVFCISVPAFGCGFFGWIIGYSWGHRDGLTTGARIARARRAPTPPGNTR